MDDLTLWKELKKGNRNAFEQIYRAHASQLLRYGKKFAVNEHVVEDAVQDLFIELWKNRTTIGNTDSIIKYLFVSLRRKIIRQLKQQNKWQSETEINEAHFQAELAIDEKMMQAELSTEHAQRLQTALAKISKRQREVVYLKYFMELDNQAIGEVMDINYQSVRNLLSGALKALKRCFWWVGWFWFIL